MSNRVKTKPIILYKLLSIKLGILCLLTSVSALASPQNTSPDSPKTTVYKVINADGSVSFSDKAEHNSVRMEVAPVATVPAYKAVRNTDLVKQSTQTDQQYYQSLEILSPANGSTFNSGAGNINISTKIEPPLRPGDLIRFTLDGKVIKSQTSASLQFSNVDRGTHTVLVELINPAKKVILSTTSQFTVHRPSIRRR